MEYTVPQRKIVELLKLLQKATSKKELTPRFVAKIAGKLIAMSIASRGNLYIRPVAS